MTFINRLNDCLNYLEDHLNDLNEIEISQVMACSFDSFERSFSQLNGYTLKEYLRRRRLTKAAYDLQYSDERVIDIAVTYGYTSADAFRVAFKSLHGVNPSDVKSDTFLRFYPKLEYELKVRGIDVMDYKLVKEPGFKVVGKRMVTPYGGGTWAVVKSDGTLEDLKKLSGTDSAMGLCFGFDENGHNDYMCGVLYDDDDHPYETYEYKPLTWLVFVSEGKLSDDVLNNTWLKILNEFLPDSSYIKLKLPTIENYLIWDETNDICKVEIKIPVRSTHE